LERLQQFNWRGLLLGVAALGMLTTGISQGEPGKNCFRYQ
jgi:hypothetical protein